MNAQRIARYAFSWIAAEVSTLSRYYDCMVQWRPRVEDKGQLLELIDSPKKVVATEFDEIKALGHQHQAILVLVNGNFNYDHDIQATLASLHSVLHRASRVVLVSYNSYLNWVYKAANWMGLRKDELPTTFITRGTLNTLARLSQFEVVRSRPTCVSPLRLKSLGNLLNRSAGVNPLSRLTSLAEVTVLRPQISSAQRPSLSIVVPTRNERGNIRAVLERIPDLGCSLEIIFVEGHSKDGTWEEIQRLIPEYQHRFPILAMQQTGIGKCDAVRLGFSQASGELLTILDADLTMPPELLGRFYDAYLSGLGDFVNGNRLTYPMEGKAMRFLNRLGNIFFAKALSAVLEAPLGDSLCGTKLVTNSAYKRMVHWRGDFGDFDPFGDFELLFPAATLGLGIIDIPIRYRDRTYGSTNISRFRHGFILLKMTAVGLFRVRLSPNPVNLQATGNLPQ
ncbi:MAG: glycosyltransferase family 2 protein [Candidatus Eremiobacteraeota bacterium]|nr:glycosyltransferase family 2 protein [Candidatus Eremiobacteraeota bacterium]MCW5868710.1 glycosyltransferase family 2 protein [Candidatus Eremiobacteraeota bacterium]